MENTHFHKLICNIIENYIYAYFQNNMEEIIEFIKNDPDFELSNKYKTTEEYHKNRKKALKMMITFKDLHFDDYITYLFNGVHVKIPPPIHNNELFKLVKFCKDKQHESYHYIAKNLIECYGIHVLNNLYGNKWIIKQLDKFVNDNQNLSKNKMEKLFPIYFIEFLENYDTKKISDILQVKADYIKYIFSKDSKLQIDAPRTGVKNLEIIEYLETIHFHSAYNFYENINIIHSVYLSKIAENLYDKEWFLERIKIRAIEIILKNPIIQFRYRDRILCKQYEKEFTQIIQ